MVGITEKSSTEASCVDLAEYAALLCRNLLSLDYWSLGGAPPPFFSNLALGGGENEK